MIVIFSVVDVCTDTSDSMPVVEDTGVNNTGTRQNDNGQVNENEHQAQCLKPHVVNISQKVMFSI